MEEDALKKAAAKGIGIGALGWAGLGSEIIGGAADVWSGYMQDQRAKEMLEYQREQDRLNRERQAAVDAEEKRRYLTSLLEKRAKQGY